MKAQDIAQAVYAAEKELTAELSGAVNKKLAELSEKTGLMLGSVTFHTNEATTFGDKDRRWIVTHTSIDRWMPGPIENGG